MVLISNIWFLVLILCTCSFYQNKVVGWGGGGYIGITHSISLLFRVVQGDCERVYQNGGVHHPIGPWPETHHNLEVKTCDYQVMNIQIICIFWGISYLNQCCCISITKALEILQHCFNSVAQERCNCNRRLTSFKFISRIDILSHSCENVIR